MNKNAKQDATNSDASNVREFEAYIAALSTKVREWLGACGATREFHVHLSWDQQGRGNKRPKSSEKTQPKDCVGWYRDEVPGQNKPISVYTIKPTFSGRVATVNGMVLGLLDCMAVDIAGQQMDSLATKDKKAKRGLRNHAYIGWARKFGLVPEGGQGSKWSKPEMGKELAEWAEALAFELGPVPPVQATIIEPKKKSGGKFVTFLCPHEGCGFGFRVTESQKKAMDGNTVSCPVHGDGMLPKDLVNRVPKGLPKLSIDLLVKKYNEGEEVTEADIEFAEEVSEPESQSAAA